MAKLGNPATVLLLQNCIVIQVNEYLLNNYWVFDTGNHLDETGTFATFISLLEGPLLLRVRRCLPIDETVAMAGRSGAGVC